MKNLIFALLASFSIHAFAGEVSPEDCDGINSNNLRYNCYAQVLELEDYRLNQAWTELKRVAVPGIYAKILTAQRTWLKFRDEDCKARTEVLAIIGEENGGVVCRALKTKTRADEIYAYVEFLNEHTEGNERE